MPGINTLLGIGIATSGLPNAINKGRSEAADRKNAELDRQLNRQNAELKRKQGELQLQSMQHTLDQQPLTDQANQLKLDQATMELQVIKKKIIRNETYTALNNFFDSGDPRSLNQFFKDYKDDPQVQSSFHNIIKVDKIDHTNPEDAKLLQTAGLTQDELDAADGKKDGQVDWSKLHKRFVKVTDKEGNTKITDMLTVASATGYGRYATDQKLKHMKALADIRKAQKGRTATSAQKNAEALAEAQDRIKNKTGTSADTALVKLLTEPKSRDPNLTKPADVKTAEALGKARTANKAGTATPEQQALIDLETSRIAGTVAGKQKLAEIARTSFHTEGLDKLTPQELQNSPRARELVNQIELAHGIGSAQQKQLVDLGSLVALSKEAGTLSASQTGAFDSLVSGATTYVSNQVKDREARATYGAFINEFRHNLFGSALTEGELKAFKDAYASDKQKIGPVLAGLRAAMIQVKSKLQTITNLNDPIVAKFRFGDTLDTAKASLASIDKRLDFYNRVSNGKTPSEAKKEVYGTANSIVKSTKQLQVKKLQTVEDVNKVLFGDN